MHTINGIVHLRKINKKSTLILNVIERTCLQRFCYDITQSVIYHLDNGCLRFALLNAIYFNGYWWILETAHKLFTYIIRLLSFLSRVKHTKQFIICIIDYKQNNYIQCDSSTRRMNFNYYIFYIFIWLRTNSMLRKCEKRKKNG